MIVDISFNLPEYLIQKGDKETIDASIKKVLNNTMKNVNPTIKSIKNEDGSTVFQTTIDKMGVVNILGGISYIKKDGEEVFLCIVDEGASELLFQFNGNKAYFCGSLSTTEDYRFKKTREGDTFKFRYTTYSKLTHKQIRDMVCPETVYKYSIK